MTPGWIALFGSAFPHQEPLSGIILGTFAVIGCVAGCVALACYGDFRRPREGGCLAAVCGYESAILPLLLFFPSQPELGLTVMGVLAFGDGMATLAGLASGRQKLPWNRNKSFAGTTAFILAAIPGATMIYWNMSLPAVPWTVALACVVPTVVCAALAESLPGRLNDNFIVGAVAAATLVPLHGALVGWS
ncbi:MAG: hypothetical protein ACT4QC_20165 [Planctomycetaceae bacterium]